MIGLIGVPITNIVSAFVIPSVHGDGGLYLYGVPSALFIFSSSAVWKSHLAGMKIVVNMRRLMRSSTELRRRLNRRKARFRHRLSLKKTVLFNSMPVTQDY